DLARPPRAGALRHRPAGRQHGLGRRARDRQTAGRSIPSRRQLICVGAVREPPVFGEPPILGWRTAPYRLISATPLAAFVLASVARVMIERGASPSSSVTTNSSRRESGMPSTG